MCAMEIEEAVRWVDQQRPMASGVAPGRDPRNGDQARCVRVADPQYRLTAAPDDS